MTPSVDKTSQAWRTWVLTGVSFLFVFICLTAGSAQEPARTEPTKSPEDIKSEETFTRTCVRCHTVDRVLGSRRTRSQWEETMTTMMTARGAIIPDEDFDVVLNYLVKEHGRVNVNRAAADDLVEVLGVPAATAESIVKYRTEHGNFEDFDAFSKVPGLELEKIEKKRDAISF